MSNHLYRSRDDRMLAGVAGGLAELWGADPSLVRLVWALLVVFTGGVALVVYIVMAIVVPEGDDGFLQAPNVPAGAAPGWTPPGTPGSSPTDIGSPQAAPDAGAAPAGYWAPGMSRTDVRAARRAARRQRGDSNAPAVIGAFLVLLGGFFLAQQWLPDLDWNWFWPVMLIALGGLLLVLALGRRPNDPGSPS
jgi:phage shock protein PspC (stress-responsive transcriptional regulator)